METMAIDEVTFASDTGLTLGDQLLNVDGMKVSELSKEDLLRSLSGEEGSTIDVLLKRDDEYGSELVFHELIRKDQGIAKPNEALRAPTYGHELSKSTALETKRRRSFANGFGDLLAGWLGKPAKA